MEKEKKITQQQELKLAKKAAAAQFLDIFEKEFDQIGEFTWVKLYEGENFSRFVEVKLTAKKSFDIDEAIENYTYELAKKG